MSGHLDGPPPGPPDPPYIPGDLGAPSAEEFARRRASSEPRPENPYRTVHARMSPPGAAWDEGFAAGRAAAPAGERITHGRHCICSACAAEDWTNPQLAPCGMHGSSCPREYAPLGPAGRAAATPDPPDDWTAAILTLRRAMCTPAGREQVERELIRPFAASPDERLREALREVVAAFPSPPDREMDDEEIERWYADHGDWFRRLTALIATDRRGTSDE